ncbi:MAG: bifunctional riboflavin kinase/FAD synthetase [Candidatus Schekmanbacteria bacterium]|nr:bifunctional riboflavin kinase/FAD synthetase [Candidatus Schekmanbacteria bacterium]
MQIIKDLLQLGAEYKEVVLTLGNYDGIHLGHQEIMKRVTAKAAQIKKPAAVFTFQEHPLKLLTGQMPPLLTTLEEKFALLEKLGIDLTVCLPFTPQIAALSAQEFIQDVIYAKLAPRWIVVGHDYAFGKNRSGNIKLLQQWSERFGYQVEIVDAIRIDDKIVGSTLIRQTLMQGKVDETEKLLGRPYILRSQVVHGQQKGKNLAFRTANLEKQTKITPACGVYAVRVYLRDKTYPGVANIGYQPTYGRNDLQIEVHILDFQEDLYDREIEVAFIARLRDERKFPDEKSLNQQIIQDVIQARQILR